MPRPLTVNQLADELRHDDDVQAVAALYAADHLGKRDASLATVLADAPVGLVRSRVEDGGREKKEGGGGGVGQGAAPAPPLH
ncbi:hypothetical protein, partial [Streptomyces prasinus]